MDRATWRVIVRIIEPMVTFMSLWGGGEEWRQRPQYDHKQSQWFKLLLWLRGWRDRTIGTAPTFRPKSRFKLDKATTDWLARWVTCHWCVLNILAMFIFPWITTNVRFNLLKITTVNNILNDGDYDPKSGVRCKRHQPSKQHYKPYGCSLCSALQEVRRHAKKNLCLPTTAPSTWWASTLKRR